MILKWSLDCTCGGDMRDRCWRWIVLEQLSPWWREKDQEENTIYTYLSYRICSNWSISLHAMWRTVSLIFSIIRHFQGCPWIWKTGNFPSWNWIWEQANTKQVCHCSFFKGFFQPLVLRYFTGHCRDGLHCPAVHSIHDPGKSSNCYSLWTFTIS